MTVNWVFDLDNTLYHPETGMLPVINEAFVQFYMQKLGVGRATAVHMIEIYAGFQPRPEGFEDPFDTFPAEEFIPTFPSHEFERLKPCFQTHELLALLPGKKAVYTNAINWLAHSSMTKLELLPHFDYVNDMGTRKGVFKHHAAAVESLLKQTEFEPSKSIMVEDSTHNLKVAKDFGFTTVLVHAEASEPYIDYCYPDLVSFLQDAVNDKMMYEQAA